MQGIPLIGKTYKFFDDGKLVASRMYDATVTRIITLSEAESFMVKAMDNDSECFTLILRSLLDIWNEQKRECDWLYDNNTDVFVECFIPDYDDELIYFVRTTDGGWFSMNIQSDWQAGSLDVDGSLYAYYLEMHNRKESNDDRVKLMKTINVLCYSHEGFNDYMRSRKWYSTPKGRTAVISICSPNDDDPVHWFDDSISNSVLNLDFDDFDPSKYWSMKGDPYDVLMEKYIHDNNNSDFYFESDNCPSGHLKAMDYGDAIKTVKFIKYQIEAMEVDDIIIHCSAGISRSQGVVRYILDTYSDNYYIHTRADNPCITPNMHVVRMLKRSANFLYPNS